MCANTEETVQAKQAFETHLQTYGVPVLQYHADNGRFQDELFKMDCEDKGQQPTFYGVNAHFQNRNQNRRYRTYKMPHVPHSSMP
jgi:hypothetical protein